VSFHLNSLILPLKKQARLSSFESMTERSLINVGVLPEALVQVLVLALSAFCFSSTACAYPEMIRHGYVNCTSCHVSPSGGGTLTDYGRGSSKDILSTWSFDGEEAWIYTVMPPEWLQLGGDFRELELKSWNQGNFQDLWIPMERDLEAAATYGKFTADVDFGWRSDENLPAQESGNWFSRRHYLMYHFNEELSLRAGRFFPQYGIMIQEHNTNIRRDLGWDEGQETYNVEAAYVGEKYNGYLTYVAGRPDNQLLYRESGVALSGARIIGDTYKLGVSYYYGASDITSHHLFGPWALLGFTRRFFLLSEISADRTYLSMSLEPTWGAVDYNRVDYEIFRGFHAYVTQEFTQTNFTENLTRTDNYGIGLQWFPRPHFEFQIFAQRKATAAALVPTADSVGLYAHFYP
jgi:hypothetical protein